MEKWVQREEGLVSTSNQKALDAAGLFVCMKLFRNRNMLQCKFVTL